MFLMLLCFKKCYNKGNCTVINNTIINGYLEILLNFRDQLRSFMKNRVISKRNYILIILVVIAIYVIGLVLPIFWGDEVKGIADLLKTVSFFFGTVGTLAKVIKTPENKSLIPIDYFTDRTDVLKNIIGSLKNNYRNQKYYPINVNQNEGTGKTQLLFKLYQLLTDKEEQKNWKNQHDNSKEMSKFFKRIGKVHFINWTGNSGNSDINELSYINNRINIVLIDDFDGNEFSELGNKFYFIFCKKISNNEEIILKNFKKEDIEEFYYKKFHKKLSSEELRRLQEYSAGNLLSLNLALKDEVSFERFLHSNDNIFTLSNLMEEGDYIQARRFIEDLTSYEKGELKSDYKYKFLMAELLHLENKYQESLEDFEFLRDENLNDKDKMKEIIERIAHVNKHLGNFKGAINELEHFPFFKEEERLPKLLSLYLLDYLYTENKISLDKSFELIQTMRLDKDMYITKSKDSFHTYEAIVLCYSRNYLSAHKSIDLSIAKYEKLKSRHVNNCYFIKAEIYRFEKKYKMAFKYYQLCLDAYAFNNDFDIYTIVYVLLKYVSSKSGISHNFEEADSEKLKEKCINLGMSFNLDLLQKLTEYLNNPRKTKEITKYFDENVFFIP